MSKQLAFIAAGAVGLFLIGDALFESRKERNQRLDNEIAAQLDSLAEAQQAHNSLTANNAALTARNEALDVHYNNVQTALTEMEGTIQDNQLRLETSEQSLTEAQQNLASVQAQVESNKVLLAEIEALGHSAELLSPNTKDGSVVVHNLIDSEDWAGFHRVITPATGLMTYPMQRGQISLSLKSLDPEAQVAMTECLETGKCLPATMSGLFQHEQKHTLDDGYHDRTTYLTEFIEWDARLVFRYYNNDPGSPVQVFKFSELAGAEELHAQADALRENLE